MSNFSRSSVLEASRESVHTHWQALLPILLLLGAPNLLYGILQPMFPTSVAISYGLYVLALAPAALGGLIALHTMRLSHQGVDQRDIIQRSIAFWGHALGLFLAELREFSLTRLSFNKCRSGSLRAERPLEVTQR